MSVPHNLEILTYPRLPARLNVQQTAALLGFAEHDIPILVRYKLLKPLGAPTQYAPKYFALSVLEACRMDEKWLSKATKAISDYWQSKNAKASKKLESTEATERDATSVSD